MRNLLLFFFMIFSVPAVAQITAQGTDAPEMFNIGYPIPTPTATFYNEFDQKISLENFRGKIVLLNVWSTACAQCIVELPTLDALQKEMGGMTFQVIALSSGLENIQVLRRFFTRRGIKHLRVYSDPSAGYSKAAGVIGLPTTFLIDKDGMEIGRIRGIVDWTNPKMKTQIRNLIRKSKEQPKVLEPESLPESSVPPPLPDQDVQFWFKK